MPKNERGSSIMFTYIELVNFKSFGKIRFDFTETKNKNKKFVAIYGENGSGKTNFVSSLELLMNSITSLSNNYQFQKARDFIEHSEEHIKDDAVIERHLKTILFYNDFSEHLKECRMIDSEEISKATYGFLANGIEGYYSLSFNDKELVEEELYYLINKQRGTLYKIKNDDKNDNEINIKFAPTLFHDTSYMKSIFDKLEMYWGKHSFLSVLLSEVQNKNYQYVKEKISDNLLKVLHNFMNVFILCKASKRRHIGIISGSKFDIEDFESVEISNHDKKKKAQLKIIEKIVNDFYTQIYSDIVKVFYNITHPHKKDNTLLRYELYVQKIIAGKNRTVPFSLESAGTQSVLAVLRAIIEALNGQTVIYDEIDSGIHDLLMKSILESIQDEITGQLIITTHNTLLLETLNPKNAYVIYTDYEGNKDARCMDDYEVRIQKTNNARKLYLNGVFGGVPYVSDIDYSQMHIDQLDDDSEE